MIISAMTGVEYDDTCINKGLSYIEIDGARHCAITGMLVGSACALSVALHQFGWKGWFMKVWWW